jgi:hypothetical protein
MGRPIQKDAFGDTAAPGLQFAITAKLPGEAVGEGYIVSQTGTSKYKVNINGTIGDVFLVNTITPANLSDGEGFIAVTPFGGSTVAARKIMQKRVNVWNTPDQPIRSPSSSYVWSDDPAAQTGQADVGVSVAAGAGNIVTTSGDGFIFNQTVSATPYKTTFKTFGWASTATPGNFAHTLHGTSDNKIVFLHEPDQDGFEGVVSVADCTTDPTPTMIGGSQTTGSTNRVMNGVEVYYDRETQLTDARYVRWAFVPGSTHTAEEIHIVDVNTTTGASSVAATYQISDNYDPLAMTSKGFGFTGGSGYTDGTQTLTVDGGTFTRAATVNVTVSGGAVTAINYISDGGEYTVAPAGNPTLTGAGGTGATLSSPSFQTNRTFDNTEKFTFRISNTLFACVFVNNGEFTNGTLTGSVQMMVLEDAGASINVIMPKTLIYDATASVDGPETTIRECSALYLDSTNRIFTVFLQSRKSDGTNQVAWCVAGKFNAGFTALDTLGTATEVVGEVENKGFNNDEHASRRIDDNHILLSYENRNGVDSPRLARIIEVDSGTLAVTPGAAMTPGPADGDWRFSFGAGSLLVISSTRALYFMPMEWNAQEQGTGTITVNQEPFDNTQDLGTTDKFVDSIANIATAWPTPTFSEIVCAINTGLTYKWNNVDTWELQTVNNSRRDYYGLYVQELTLNTTTNTITLGKDETLINEQFPRWRLKDGATAPYDVSEIEPTHTHSTRATEALQSVLLPNGKIVVSGFVDNRYLEEAPFLTRAAYDARDTTLEDGMGYWVQYFDPDAMP